jgi:hypothetical protein
MFKAKIISSDYYYKTRNVRPYLFGFLGILVVIMQILSSDRFRINIAIMATILLLFVLTSIASLVVFIYSRNAKVLGHMSISPEVISITLNNTSQTFSVKDVTNLKIIQNTYAGGDYKNHRKIDNNYSGNNWLIFNYKDQEYRYEFKLDTMYSTNQLYKVRDYWKNNGMMAAHEII